MAEKEDLDNAGIDTLDALFAQLTGNTTDNEGDGEYPLPEKKPLKVTNVDVVVMPRGYKSETPKSEAKDSKPRFTDSLPSMKLDVDSAKEADGVLSVPVTAANAQHIYDYDGLKVRKPFEELEAAAMFCDGRPVSREHPTAGIVTDRGEVLGFFKNPLANDDVLKGVLQITDKDLIADVKSKKLSDVSLSFYCDLDRSASGELNGEHYDATQRNIFIDHIAICENGRCSIEDGCGIGLDAKKYPVPSELVDKITAAIERAKAMKDKSLYNLLKELLKGVSVKKDSEEKKTVDADALNLVKLKDGFAKLTAERDGYKAQVEDMVKAERDSLIAERKALLDGMEDTKTKEDLEKLALDELQREVDFVKATKAKHLSVPDSSRTPGRDAIYSKIGKGGK